jgi:hypothetical protein
MKQLQWLADNGFYLSLSVLPNKTFRAFLSRWDNSSSVNLEPVDNLEILLSVVMSCAMDYLAGDLTNWESYDVRSE